MSSGFASALEKSARLIRANMDAPAAARRLITEELHLLNMSTASGNEENFYIENMQAGYRAALAGLYEIAQRKER